METERLVFTGSKISRDYYIKVEKNDGKKKFQYRIVTYCGDDNDYSVSYILPLCMDSINRCEFNSSIE